MNSNSNTINADYNEDGKQLSSLLTSSTTIAKNPSDYANSSNGSHETLKNDHVAKCININGNNKQSKWQKASMTPLDASIIYNLPLRKTIAIAEPLQPPP
eukprot:15205449-Ditylum_brightwellii.AAC.1